jgi:hypothetical protein
MKRTLSLLALLLLSACPAFAQTTPVPPLLNFQGRLARPDGTPVPDATYSLQVTLYDAVTGGTQKWSETLTNVSVKNGVFAVLLGKTSPLTDAVFAGSLWLEIKLGSDVPLSPRQQLVSVAYAFKASTVPDSSITSTQLADRAVTGDKIANGAVTAEKLAPGAVTAAALRDVDWKQVSGLSSNFSLLSNSLFSHSLSPNSIRTRSTDTSWLLLGNAGTDPATNFLGTTDNRPLVIKVNNHRAIRLTYVSGVFAGNTDTGINLLAGYEGNNISDGVVAATIAGGGFRQGSLELPNRVTDLGGTVGGGAFNTAGNTNTVLDDAFYATVSGGYLNVASGADASVGGGTGNVSGGYASTVSGGYQNAARQGYTSIAGGYLNVAGDYFAVVSGGYQNIATGSASTVGGGKRNSVSGPYAVIGGGEQNTASGDYASVAGGSGNTASGDFAIVGGGFQNVARTFYDTVGGGFQNAANGGNAIVGGGEFNIASGEYATVGGGASDTASGFTATVAGGNVNTASGINATVGGGGANNATGTASTVAGGDDNTASGDYATVAGGVYNVASGQHSFAAGFAAQAGHAGTFVWNDTSDLSIPPHSFASTGPNQFLIHVAGGVGINTNDPAGYALNVNGNISCISLTQTSDARFKTNVQTFNNALDAILSLRGISFDWDRQAWKEKNFPAGRQIGFLAQEVEQVLPELVSTDRQGYKSVAYANVVPVLVEAIKQQQSQMDAQQKQLEAVRAENERLKSRLKQMETMQSQLSALSARLAQVEARQSRN